MKERERTGIMIFKGTRKDKDHDKEETIKDLDHDIGRNKKGQRSRYLEERERIEITIFERMRKDTDHNI